MAVQPRRIGGDSRFEPGRERFHHLVLLQAGRAALRVDARLAAAEARGVGGIRFGRDGDEGARDRIIGDRLLGMPIDVGGRLRLLPSFGARLDLPGLFDGIGVRSLSGLFRLGVDIELSTPEEFGRLIESEMHRWGKVVRALNLKVQ